jgi:hypothetical protein
MRIAFDVLGTIQGPKGSVILEAFKRLQDAGHECVVWSSDYGLAVNAVKRHALNADSMGKLSGYELTERGLEAFDVAIEDDRGQTYLGAARFVWVDTITDVDSLVESILKGGTNDTTKI